MSLLFDELGAPSGALLVFLSLFAAPQARGDAVTRRHASGLKLECPPGASVDAAMGKRIGELAVMRVLRPPPR